MGGLIKRVSASLRFDSSLKTPKSEVRWFLLLVLGTEGSAVMGDVSGLWLPGQTTSGEVEVTTSWRDGDDLAVARWVPWLGWSEHKTSWKLLPPELCLAFPRDAEQHLLPAALRRAGWGELRVGGLGGDRAPAAMGPLPWETPSLPGAWERDQPPAQAIATSCVAEGTSHAWAG